MACKLSCQSYVVCVVDRVSLTINEIFVKVDTQRRERRVNKRRDKLRRVIRRQRRQRP